MTSPPPSAVPRSATAPSAASRPSALRRVSANGLELAYETIGRATDPPVLFIMGLGAQLITWPTELCRQVADGGRYVVRYDNRDVGESTHLDGAHGTSVRSLALGVRRPVYTIEDLAEDAAGLLEALDLGAAHVVGASMGGFIAQSLAIRHPRRVRGLTLLMTSTGSRRVGRPSPRLALAMAGRRRAATRAEAIELAVRTARLTSSPGYAFDEELRRDTAARSYDRGYDPAGVQRQLAACVAQRDRTADLRRLAVPTRVLHGLSDPLVNVSGGLALARAIPGARFVGFAGMGHDLPRPLWPEVADEILATTASLDSALR